MLGVPSLGLGFLFGVEGLGFGVQGLGFRVQGVGFRVEGLGFRIQGLGFGLGFGSRLFSMFLKLPKTMHDAGARSCSVHVRTSREVSAGTAIPRLMIAQAATSSSWETLTSPRLLSRA